MELGDIINWLQEGDEWDAAEVLWQCDVRYEYVDIGFPLNDGPEIAILEVYVHSPRKVLDRLGTDLKSETDSIEHAIRELASAEHSYVRDIYWVPRVGVASYNPSDDEIEQALAVLDADHVRSAWAKALQRRQTDPDGAITAARTLLESVCKHILESAGKQYPRNADLPNLYKMVCEILTLLPSQHLDKKIKGVLGNCQSVVSGISFLRNQLGDAHAREPGLEITGSRFGELAVNLAGTMATFLAKTWQNTKATCDDR
jgi:hypothetical protein